MNDDLASLIIRETRSVNAWIDRTLERFADRMVPVAKLGFPRLSRYFSAGLLSGVKAIVVDGPPPLPPPLLEVSGILRLSPESVGGITYKNAYFVRDLFAHDESLHFHEIVHAVQWARLGAERFIMAYVRELLEHGYTANFFEGQAAGHQGRFDSGGRAYNAERAVLRELDAFLRSMGGREKSLAR